jgi:dephospho-CoA kinase
MKKIAITGNIGSGKTTISNILLKAGYKVFQCDKEISNLYLVKNIKNEIKNTFENKVKNLFFKNGRINKVALSNYVFSSSIQLRRLEKIIYYYLEITKKDFLEKNKKKEILFFDIPLLFEKKLEDEYDFIIYLFLNRENQKKRVLKRKNMSEDKLKKILKNQKGFSKSKKISLLIDTNKKKVEVKQTLLEFIKKLG